jgi:hypothetical protein
MADNDEETWIKVSEWLLGTDTPPDEQHYIAIDQKQEGTCTWITEHQVIKDWKESSGSLCIIEGGRKWLCLSRRFDYRADLLCLAGVGKTILW